MEIIKRYVYAVTKKLPEKQRYDISRELLSDIEAMVGDRAGSDKATEKHAREVLQQLGDPEVFAEQYHERKWLIGPVLFDTYLTSLKALLFIVIPIVGMSTLVASLLAGEHGGKIIADLFGVVLQVGVHIFFWTTLLFAIAERYGVKEKPAAKQAWSPSDLPEIPPGNTISKSESIHGLVWSLVAVVAVGWQIPLVHTVIPLPLPLYFSEQMWPYWTLGLLAITLGALAVEIVRLIHGVWNLLTACLITIVNSALLIYFMALLLFVQSVVSETFVQELARGTHNPDMVQIASIVAVIFPVMVSGVAIVEIVSAWYKYKNTKKEA